MQNISRQQNRAINYLLENKYRVYRHLFMWVYLIFTEYYDPGEPREFSGNYDLYLRITKLLFFILMVYTNMYLLVPKLLFRDKYLAYICTLVTMITINHFLIEHFYEYNFGAYRIFKARRYTSVFREIIANTNILGVIVFSSTSIKLLQRWQKDTVRINELEKKSLQIELRELKNQINPHFLFNMLNNANVLVLKDPEKASVVLMKLSDFLHHQLYENNNKLVSLQSEITFLNDFLELEKIRRDDFSFTITNKNPGKPGDLLLPPSLFTTFVENAVKHSADPDDVPSRVDLSFTRDNKSIFFTCINTKPGDPSSKTTGGGLGLTNITRRLDLLYGKHYTLKINETDSLYKVILHLPL